MSDDFKIDKDDPVHKYWYAFSDHFSKLYGNKFDGMVDTNKMVGYDCMKQLDEYAKSHPEIKIVGVDDSVFASSYVVLVPHPSFGITMIFVPQCTDVKNELFMYPRHSERILYAITEMKHRYNI